MSLTIQETFQVHASTERVWEYLTDPTQVVNCLPGAELVSVESPTSFVGRVKVKVGPVVAAYDGKVNMVERDATAHVVRMVAEGRETSGSGSAKMTMTSSLFAVAGGSTEVRVVAQVDVVGRIAQFGRGMIESVNKQLFKQFTACVQATLELPLAPAAVPSLSLPSVEIPSVSMVSADAGRPVRLVPLVLRALWERFLAIFRPAKA